MITIESIRINSQDALVVEPKLATKDSSLVLYYHGIGGRRTDELSLAYKLAESGLRVVLMDLHLHNDGTSRETQERNIVEIIEKTVENLKNIYVSLKETYNLREGQFYMGGTSLGAIVTAAALKRYPFIKKSALLMGTAKLSMFLEAILETDDSPYEVGDQEKEALKKRIEALDLSNRLDLLDDRDLFIWHGEHDQVIPVSYTHTFIEELQASEAYTGTLTSVIEPFKQHKVSHLAQDACVEFFKVN